MRYVAAYLLAILGGKDNPGVADIEKVLSSVGIESDAEKLKKVTGELNGKNIEEIISKGKEKLASIPTGGAVAAAAPSAAPEAAAGKGSPEKKEDKKEAKKEEPEESDDDMGFGLFD